MLLSSVCYLASVLARVEWVWWQKDADCGRAKARDCWLVILGIRVLRLHIWTLMGLKKGHKENYHLDFRWQLYWTHSNFTKYVMLYTVIMIPLLIYSRAYFLITDNGAFYIFSIYVNSGAQLWNIYIVKLQKNKQTNRKPNNLTISPA